MSCCRKWREHCVEAVYGELDGERRTAFAEHRQTCPRCAAELDRLSSTVAMLRREMPPRPRPGELDAWARLSPAIAELDERARHPRPRRRIVLGYPAAAAMAAALVVLGLGLGLLLRAPATLPVPGPLGVRPPATTAAAADIDTQLGRYLERATPLLLAVANRRSAGAEAVGFEPAVERRRADQLAGEAAEIRAKLAEHGRRRQADLVTDIEVVFLQIANLPEREYRRGLEMVRATIETQALLFQLSVEEMRRLGAPEV